MTLENKIVDLKTILRTTLESMGAKSSDSGTDFLFPYRSEFYFEMDGHKLHLSVEADSR